MCIRDRFYTLFVDAIPPYQPLDSGQYEEKFLAFYVRAEIRHYLNCLYTSSFDSDMVWGRKEDILYKEHLYKEHSGENLLSDDHILRTVQIYCRELFGCICDETAQDESIVACVVEILEHIESLVISSSIVSLSLIHI